jgi:hypothetical protein
MLAIGLTLVVFGLYPYWWLDVLTRLQGGRAGNEGEGMGGFLIMIFFGTAGPLIDHHRLGHDRIQAKDVIHPNERFRRNQKAARYII